MATPTATPPSPPGPPPRRGRRVLRHLTPDWVPGYRTIEFRSDLSAGITVAAMLVPQGMAYALLAGLPPEVGLYASILPLVAYALLGTSRQLAVGPVAIVSLLTASSLAPLVDEGTSDYVAAAALLALLVGAVHLLFGLARLGRIVTRIPHAAMVGFTAAAALIIGASQIKHVAGLDLERSDRVIDTISSLVANAADIHWPTAAVAAGSVLLLLVLRRVSARVPAALVVVAAAIVAVNVLGLDERGVAVVGDIPGSLPSFALPTAASGLVGDLLVTALVITFVGFMESVAVARVYAKRQGYELDPDRELVGLGAANVTSGVFGGYPVTGGFSRTAVNADAGAETPMAQIVAAGGVLAAVALFTPALASLPKATLAAVILVAVAGLIDVPEIRTLWAEGGHDRIALVVVAAVTLVVGIEAGIAAIVAVTVSDIVRRRIRPSDQPEGVA